MTLNLTKTPDQTTTTSKPSSGVHHPSRRMRIVAATSVIAGLTAATVVFWPDSGGSSPSSELSPRPVSVLESPSAFDEAVDDAVRQIDDSDSVLLDGDAFDRAVAEASGK